MELRAPFEPRSRHAYLTNILHDLGAAQPSELACSLLAQFPTFAALSAASKEDLSRHSPMTSGLSKALAAALKIVSAGVREEAIETKLEPADEALLSYLRLILSHREEEILIGLFARCDGSLIAEHTLAIGNGHSVKISAAAVLRQAIALCASRILLVHNHPSGQASPSLADKAGLGELDRRAAALDLEIMDHLIVGRSAIFSMRLGRVL